MYHSISDQEATTDPGGFYYGLRTSSEVFAAHMAFLRDQGYRVIPLPEIEQHLSGADSQPVGRLAVLTFDDGYRDFLTQAFPVLERFGFTATVFLPTGFIDAKGSKLSGRECLSWADVRELHRRKILFGSHTASHKKLGELATEEIRQELVLSKHRIEEEIGEGITCFAYPFAFPEADRELTGRVRALLEGAGYRTGVTTKIGTTTREDDRYALKRIPLNSYDDRSLLRAKLEGGYDWLQKPQHLYKRLKGKRR